ncbi:MAG: hypothetical protein ACP5ON_06850, partial [Bacteroidota bacterium]
MHKSNFLRAQAVILFTYKRYYVILLLNLFTCRDQRFTVRSPTSAPLPTVFQLKSAVSRAAADVDVRLT